MVRVATHLVAHFCICALIANICWQHRIKTELLSICFMQSIFSCTQIMWFTIEIMSLFMVSGHYKKHLQLDCIHSWKSQILEILDRNVFEYNCYGAFVLFGFNRNGRGVSKRCLWVFWHLFKWNTTKDVQLHNGNSLIWKIPLTHFKSSQINHFNIWK